MPIEKIKFPPVIKLICNDDWNCIEKCAAIKLLALCFFGDGCSKPWKKHGSRFSKLPT